MNKKISNITSENLEINLLDEELFDSFNITVKDAVISINIDTEKLLNISKLIKNKAGFIEKLEFVLSKNAVLVPDFILEAIKNINIIEES